MTDKDTRTLIIGAAQLRIDNVPAAWRNLTTSADDHGVDLLELDNGLIGIRARHPDKFEFSLSHSELTEPFNRVVFAGEPKPQIAMTIRWKQLTEEAEYKAAKARGEQITSYEFSRAKFLIGSVRWTIESATLAGPTGESLQTRLFVATDKVLLTVTARSRADQAEHFAPFRTALWAGQPQNYAAVLPPSAPPTPAKKKRAKRANLKKAHRSVVDGVKQLARALAQSELALQKLAFYIMASEPLVNVIGTDATGQLVDIMISSGRGANKRQGVLSFYIEGLGTMDDDGFEYHEEDFDVETLRDELAPTFIEVCRRYEVIPQTVDVLINDE
ncbi:MAG: hypothetical protein H6707_01020 [Deltaproteobacteria bacterium]|nr:hypothetical protein [Deltaproteobacteria bacterium]